jgi:nuclear transcription factor Y gamma
VTAALQASLAGLWVDALRDARAAGADPAEFKAQQLPLARIKKIMKSDEDVRMISAEAPVLFAKACELFVLELTLRAWAAAEEARRRTLQRSDVAAAVHRTEVFDFLVDVVPPAEGEDGAGGAAGGAEGAVAAAAAAAAAAAGAGAAPPPGAAPAFYGGMALPPGMMFPGMVPPGMAMYMQAAMPGATPEAAAAAAAAAHAAAAAQFGVAPPAPKPE